jgi:hypothetical protein
VSDCCLTPNEQYEELDISKNSGKPYKNTTCIFDKEDINKRISNKTCSTKELPGIYKYD